MSNKLPAKIGEPFTKETIEQIAMDIGKDTVDYIEWMYPKAIEATSSTFKLSVRNHIYNQIMAAVEVTDEGKILARLQDRKEWRRKFKKLRNLSKNANPENAEETLKKLMELK